MQTFDLGSPYLQQRFENNNFNIQLKTTKQQQQQLPMKQTVKRPLVR